MMTKRNDFKRVLALALEFAGRRMGAAPTDEIGEEGVLEPFRDLIISPSICNHDGGRRDEILVLPD